MAARRQSAVEVAGGYLLDQIRAERQRNATEHELIRLRAMVEQLEQVLPEAVAAYDAAWSRTQAYIRAAVEAE